MEACKSLLLFPAGVDKRESLVQQQRQLCKHNSHKQNICNQIFTSTEKKSLEAFWQMDAECSKSLASAGGDANISCKVPATAIKL